MKCANCKRTAEPGAAFCDSFCEVQYRRANGAQATEKLKDAATEADSLPYVWNSAADEAEAQHKYDERDFAEGRD
jgi:hypothetical protein